MAAKMKNGGIGGSNSINGGIEEKWRQNGENSLAAMAASGGNKSSKISAAWRRQRKKRGGGIIGDAAALSSIGRQKPSKTAS
jgi:hypothetical protein